MTSTGRAPGAVFAINVAIALITAAAVFLGGGGEAFWLCLPAVLLASARARSRAGAALAAATVLAAALASSLPWLHLHRLPSPLLVLIVPLASAAVIVAVRERLGRERDALRDSPLTDPLTGLANGRSLLWRAEYEIARHRRGERSFAVVMVDLDGFARVKDRFGRTAGDDLLRGVAATLKRSMRAQDTVAHITGGEFSVLAPETDAAGAHELAARISDAVFEIAAGSETRASLGVAIFPEDGTSAAALVHAAAEPVLAAKRSRQSARAAGARPRPTPKRRQPARAQRRVA
jgi:diguanylate cyclase (GGDEF)-like protein